MRLRLAVQPIYAAPGTLEPTINVAEQNTVQGFMSWETAERQHGRLRVEIVEAAITIMVAQAVV